MSDPRLTPAQKQEVSAAQKALARIEAAHQASGLSSVDFFEALARMAENDAILRAALCPSRWTYAKAVESDEVRELLKSVTKPIDTGT